MGNGCWVLAGEPHKDEAQWGSHLQLDRLLTSPSLHLLICRMGVLIGSVSLKVSKHWGNAGKVATELGPWFVLETVVQYCRQALT